MEKLITFENIVEDFLYFKKVKVKNSTLSNYNFNIIHRLYPEFKNMTIKELEIYNFNRFTDKLSETLSKKTVKDTVILLKEILKYAEKKYNADFKLDLISIPNVEKKEVKIFNDKDRINLEKSIFKDKDIRYLGIIISLYSGMRIGEICALKWKNIDFNREIINVEKTVERINLKDGTTKVIIDTPKTKKSIRRIPLAKKLKEKLNQYANIYSKDSFILTGSETKFFEPISYRLCYKKLLNDLNIEYKSFHTLRHTFATRCVETGIDIKSLSEILRTFKCKYNIKHLCTFKF